MEIIQNLVSKSDFHISSKNPLWETIIEDLQVTKGLQAAFGTPSLGKHHTFISWHDVHRTALLLSDRMSTIREKSSTQDHWIFKFC